MKDISDDEPETPKTKKVSAPPHIFEEGTYSRVHCSPPRRHEATSSPKTPKRRRRIINRELLNTFG